MRHKWTKHHRTWGSHRSKCERCGLIRDQRFDRSTHWVEYMRDGRTIATNHAPPCEPASSRVEAKQGELTL